MNDWGDPLPRQVVYLLDLIRSNNSWTYDHSVGTADIAVQRAIDLGCSSEEIEKVRLGALLHDVGKPWVPNKYLNKPDELLAYQKQIVDFHAPIGGHILRASGLGQLAIFAEKHHKPGDNPLVQIVSMADYEHAATNPRPNSNGRPLIEVIPELAEIYPSELVDAIRPAA
jgi:putative nucleotidyltransferase with HDIG domain